MDQKDAVAPEPELAGAAGERHPLEAVADQFTRQLRGGGQPDVSDYVARYPQLADQLRELLPTLLVLEQVGAETGRPPPTEAAPGEPVLQRLGPYRILREVGRGGMGIVYEAQHDTMRRRVALKVLPPNVAADRAHLERFHREARAAGRLHHTNIVPVFEVGSVEDVHYYAMQFIRGQSLDAVFDDLRRLETGGSPLDSPPSPDAATGHSAVTRAWSRAPTSLTPPHAGLPRELPTFGAPSPCAAHAVGDPVLPSLGPTDETWNMHLGSAREESGDLNGCEAGDLPARPAEATSKTHESARPGAKRDLAHSSLHADSRSGDSYFRRIAHVGLQVAQALTYAHRQGVLHRDIKPANLILDTAGVVWVTDFGLAKDHEGDLTRTGDIVGTLRYLAPERLDGEADARSDIYGLGLTLYELCTLQHAFKPSAQATLLRQLIQQEPPSPRQWNPAIPRDLETIILKAIAKQPEHRYATARQMAEDLQLYLEDRPIRSRPTPRYERAWRWCRRNPQQAILASLALVLLGIVFCGSLTFAVVSNRQAQKLRDETIRARENERLAQRRLYDFSRGKSQALRWTGRPGQRLEGLEAVREAALILPQLGFNSDEIEQERFLLRNEAIANLALPDVATVHQWEVASGWTNSVAFDAKYQLYAQGSQDGEIVVRRVDSNELVQRLVGNGERAWIIAFDPDGRRLAAKYHRPDGPPRVCLWNLKSGECLLNRTDRLGNSAFAFHPEGKQFALGTLDGIELLDPMDGRLIETLGEPLNLAYLAYSPDGRFLAGSDMARAAVQLWDPAAGVARQLNTSSAAYGIAFHPDGSRLAVGLANGSIEIVPLPDGSRPAVGLASGSMENVPLPDGSATESPSNEKRTWLEGHRGQVVGVAVDASGTWLASSSWDGTVRFWDLRSGESVLRVDGMTAARFQFHQDTPQLAFRSIAERRFGVWQLHHEGPLRILTAPEEGAGYAVAAWRPGDERWLVAAHPLGVDIWDLLTATRVRRLNLGNTRSLWFSSDGGMMLTSGTEGVRRWKLQPGHLIPAAPPEVLLGSFSERMSVAGNGQLLAVDQGMLHAVLLRPDTQESRRVIAQHTGLDFALLSPDGQWLVTSTWQGAGIRVWSTESLELIHELEPETGSATIAFDAAGKWLVVSSATAHRLYEADTWRQVWEIQRHTDDSWPGPVAFSPDGKWLAITHNRNLITLVDAMSGRPRLQLESPRPAIYGSFQFRSDGSQLVAAARQDLQLWDLGSIEAELRGLHLTGP